MGTCKRCGKASGLKCARCHASYCSRQCQRDDWSEHKESCLSDTTVEVRPARNGGVRVRVDRPHGRSWDAGTVSSLDDMQRALDAMYQEGLLNRVPGVPEGTTLLQYLRLPSTTTYATKTTLRDGPDDQLGADTRGTRVRDTIVCPRRQCAEAFDEGFEVKVFQDEVNVIRWTIDNKRHTPCFDAWFSPSGTYLRGSFKPAMSDTWVAFDKGNPRVRNDARALLQHARTGRPWNQVILKGCDEGGTAGTVQVWAARP